MFNLRSIAPLVYLVVSLAGAAVAEETPIERGAYLVTIAGCGDCHTPGHFLGQPDQSRLLGGSDVGFEIPGLGTFYGPNLTPDAKTGLGNWTEAEIMTALTTGVRPDGRQLAPAMPWMSYANLATQDVHAITAYLKSLPVVSNKVIGPFGPSETVQGFVMRVIPPGG
ncbi:c-type cytochrome [Fuscibacter oryzae]|uniref:Cytochrome c n=1 Tax=Fuscibacter oryzae TaxID=2803939 RepID=A0A8J7MT66_9RHOB|nr:c-type cytochrome [Fuscibacter oryzae]MBL4928510.1 cytochrome c [Fuscibacter oryzae]